MNKHDTFFEMCKCLQENEIALILNDFIV